MIIIIPPYKIKDIKPVLGEEPYISSKIVVWDKHKTIGDGTFNLVRGWDPFRLIPVGLDDIKDIMAMQEQHND